MPNQLKYKVLSLSLRDGTKHLFDAHVSVSELADVFHWYCTMTIETNSFDSAETIAKRACTLLLEDAKQRNAFYVTGVSRSSHTSPHYTSHSYKVAVQIDKDALPEIAGVEFTHVSGLEMEISEYNGVPTINEAVRLAIKAVLERIPVGAR